MRRRIRKIAYFREPFFDILKEIACFCFFLRRCFQTIEKIFFSVTMLNEQRLLNIGNDVGIATEGEIP